MHDHHEVGRGLCHRDPDIAHFNRQPRLSDRHPVLHLDLRDIEVCAELESDRDGKAAIPRGV